MRLKISLEKYFKRIKKDGFGATFLKSSSVWRLNNHNRRRSRDELTSGHDIIEERGRDGVV
jgi:hypothetical protein